MQYSSEHLEMIGYGRRGHLGGSFQHRIDCCALRRVMNVSPSEPQKPGRDKLIYSKDMRPLRNMQHLENWGFSRVQKAKL